MFTDCENYIIPLMQSIEMPVKTFLRCFGIVFIVILFAGCAPTPTATPAPTLTPSAIPAPTSTPIAHNADWTPVTEKINGVEMVQVPAGCFTMGLETGRREERPTTKICLGMFWLDKTEVTNAAYGSEGAYKGANRPRENLTWAEANAFCQKRGARLPTEAEWEYAARGPDNLIYPWGNTLDPERLVYDKNMNNFETFDVGSKPSGASWVGALDMSGNVFEWTHSLYKPYPYSATDGREDDANQTDPRVYRGGWQSYVDNATGGTMRFRKKPDDRDWHIGFRCALTK